MMAVCFVTMLLMAMTTCLLVVVMSCLIVGVAVSCGLAVVAMSCYLAISLWIVTICLLQPAESCLSVPKGNDA